MNEKAIEATAKAVRETATAAQECQNTEYRIDEILRIASQDMTAAFGDGGEQYRREALAAILATVGNAAVSYERQRRTAGQEWREQVKIAQQRRLLLAIAMMLLNPDKGRAELEAAVKALLDKQTP